MFSCTFHVDNGQSLTNMCEYNTGVWICIFHVYNEESPTNISKTQVFACIFHVYTGQSPTIMCECNAGVYMYHSCLQWAKFHKYV